MEVTGGEEALKEALYTKGPMTVSVDAGPDAFQFYKSGVFDEAKSAPLCIALLELWLYGKHLPGGLVLVMTIQGHM